MSRESRLDRRAPHRSARPRLLVVLGSDCTERQYFAGLRDSLDNRAVDRAALADCAATVRRLRRYLPRYDKTRLDFADFAKTVPDAIVRARALDAAATTDHLQNPSTSVWRLVEKIMG